MGEVIRKELLSVSMDPSTETLLFFASRAEHIAQVIRPAIERGAWVLSDRFTDATYAYQVGGRGFPAHKVEELERWTHGDLQPDRTVLFDIEPEVAAERVARARNLDRFEKENLDFFKRVRQAYLTRAKQSPNRFLIIDSMQDKDTVSAILKEFLIMGIAVYPWQEELARELVSFKDNLPNGLLVYGPRGIGTIDLVIAYAKSLFCEHPHKDGTPCGQCKGCKMANAFTHPDLRYVVSEAESIPRGIPFEPPSNATKDRKIYREILIHQPRELTDFLNLAPHIDKGRRIIVVYPADAIRADAAATFLKSLEEPPERTTFLLVADDIDRVLPTIRSRCRLLRAKAPTHEESLQWLKSVGIEDAQEALARAAERPCLVTDERAIRNNAEIDAKVRDQLLTLTTMAPSIRMALLKTLSQGPSIELTNIAVKEGRSALPVSAVLPVLERWSYDLLAVKQGLEPHYFPAYSPQMKSLVSSVGAEKLF